MEAIAWLTIWYWPIMMRRRHCPYLHTPIVRVHVCLASVIIIHRPRVNIIIQMITTVYTTLPARSIVGIIKMDTAREHKLGQVNENENFLFASVCATSQRKRMSKKKKKKQSNVCFPLLLLLEPVIESVKSKYSTKAHCLLSNHHHHRQTPFHGFAVASSGLS